MACESAFPVEPGHPWGQRRGAGKQRDRVFLLANPGGVREDDKNQTVMDIVASACLCDFTPMGDGRQHDGPMYSDLAHFPPAVWAPSAPYHFGDTQSALLAAREVASGQFASMFAGFEPDEVPLSRRRIAATFITGNPRPGQAFLQALERSLEIPNIVIAHWLATCKESWMIFAVPVTPWEVRSAGLHFDLRAFAPAARGSPGPVGGRGPTGSCAGRSPGWRVP